jgi:hypothetical protein
MRAAGTLGESTAPGAPLRAEWLAQIASRRPLAVTIVGCGKAKASTARCARELYTGSLFRAALQHAEATSDIVFIVSAKHGLLELDQIVEPYDVALGRGSAAHAWGRGVLDALNRAIGHWRRQVTVLAGGAYADALGLALLGKHFEPLSGMTFGRRLAFFANARRSRALVEAYLAAGAR